METVAGKRELLSAVAVFAGGAALVACALLLGFGWPAPLGQLAGFTLFTLLMLSMAFPAPHMGFASLDRVSLVAMLLIFGPVTASIASAVAYLVWTPFSLRDREQSPVRGLARWLHNAGMMTMVAFAGAYAYMVVGGTTPLMDLDFYHVGELIALALAIQITNDLLICVLAWSRGQSFRSGWSGYVDLIEIAMVPVGVFTAVVYAASPTGSFALLVIVLFLLAVLMRAFSLNRADLENRVRQMKAINELAQAANAAVPLDKLAEFTHAQSRKVIGDMFFTLALYDRDANELDVLVQGTEAEYQPRRRVPAGHGALGWVIDHNRSVLIRDWKKEDSELKHLAVQQGEPPVGWLGVPVRHRDRILGGISLQSFRPNAFRQSDLELMQTFADEVGTAVANANLFGELSEYKKDLEEKVAERTQSLTELNERNRKLVEQLDRLSKEDSLTGLSNRRFMEEHLARETRRAKRFGREITIAMADLDHFKRVNDSYSHAVGDRVLEATGVILQNAVRAVDVVSRYGGEEFVICFPETDPDDARGVCERIRSTMQEYDWDAVQPGLVMTISIGVAGGTEYDPETLLAQADKKLYEAKEAGRNRVCG